MLVIKRREAEGVHLLQHPVYFVSEVLIGAKIHYSLVQKLMYTVLITN
jgi:hypothetical protein